MDQLTLWTRGTAGQVELQTYWTDFEKKFFLNTIKMVRSSVPVICVLLGLTLLAMGPDLASSQKVIININGGWR